MKPITETPMSEDGPQPVGLRSFSLDSPEAYEALCDPAERAWIPNGALPREPRWPRKPSSVSVIAENEADADDGFRNWLAHVDAGRIGSIQER